MNHSAPSGPRTIRFGDEPGVSGYSVKWPSSVIRPTLAAERSMNQIASSGPSAPLWVVLLGVGTGKSTTSPVAGFKRATAFDPCSGTYTLPSGAKTVPCGMACGHGEPVLAHPPAASIRPTLPVSRSQNERLRQARPSATRHGARRDRLPDKAVVSPCWSTRTTSLLPIPNHSLPTGPARHQTGSVANPAKAVAQPSRQAGGPLALSAAVDAEATASAQATAAMRMEGRFTVCSFRSGESGASRFTQQG